VWTRQFGSGAFDQAYGVTVGASGVYLAGATNGVLPGQAGSGDFDAYVRRYDADGNEMWTRQFGTSSHDQVYGILVDASGVYAAGWTWGAFPGQARSGGYDAFVRKYDVDGNEVWTRQFGTASHEYAYRICANATGIYLVGWTYGTFPGQTGSGGPDVFVRKYDVDGNAVWTRQFGTADMDFAYGICADASGVYLAGVTYGSFPGQIYEGDRDVFVSKYDNDGNALWTRQFGTALREYAYDICAGATGVYVAGSTEGTLPGQASAGDYDVYVRKYSAEGLELWTHQFGTPSRDYAYGVCVGGAAVYASGFTAGAFPGETPGGGWDAFVAKLSVPTPARATENLIATLEGLALPVGIENSLRAPLLTAVDALERGNEQAAAGKLGAFIHHVEAQTGKKLAEADADALVDTAEAILAAIASGPAPAAKMAVGPTTLVLATNAPNPFNPSTTIRYALAEPAHVRLTVYTVLGQQVRVLVDGPQPSGSHQVVWDARGAGGHQVTSGVYLYRLEAGDDVAVRKMEVIR
jgi:hypothetical protein